MVCLKKFLQERAWQKSYIILSLWVWLVGINSSVYSDELLGTHHGCGCCGCVKQDGQAHTVPLVQWVWAGLTDGTQRSSDDVSGGGKRGPQTGEGVLAGATGALAWTRWLGKAVRQRCKGSVRTRAGYPGEMLWAEWSSKGKGPEAVTALGVWEQRPYLCSWKGEPVYRRWASRLL